MPVAGGVLHSIQVQLDEDAKKIMLGVSQHRSGSVCFGPSGKKDENWSGEWRKFFHQLRETGSANLILHRDNYLKLVEHYEDRDYTVEGKTT